jgi:LmbE family N-acetylglucosaminyl deacetylase
VLRLAVVAACSSVLAVSAWAVQPARETHRPIDHPAESAPIAARPPAVAAALPPVLSQSVVQVPSGALAEPPQHQTGPAQRVSLACGRPGTVVFYSPHEDDETLSMGELIARYAACHWQVQVVLVTDGSTSAARFAIDSYLALSHLPSLSIPAFVAAREREFVAALGELGVPAGHVHFAGWLGGALTVAEAESTIAKYAAEFPGALHVTMSQWDVNPDHRALGTALAQLAVTRRLQARWVVFHRYWASATFRSSCSVVEVPFALPRIAAAADVYARWDPMAGWYAIGVISVAHDFQVLRADPRDLVCTTSGPIMTRIPGTTLPVLVGGVSRPAGTGSTAG